MRTRNHREIRSAADRLFARVIPEPNTGCWLWEGSTNAKGRGRIGVGIGANARNVSVHRLAYEVTYGAIPKGMGVLHRCDVPCCANPAHLFLGDQKANVADMLAKKREARGERCGAAKLTTDDVLDIRNRLGRGESACSIARLFGVSDFAVRAIRDGRYWTHVSATPPSVSTEEGR